jgi:hypothetical protein
MSQPLVSILARHVDPLNPKREYFLRECRAGVYPAGAGTRTTTRTTYLAHMEQAGVSYGKHFARYVDARDKYESYPR